MYAERYALHLRLPELGPRGQERLRASTALLVGVGALGSAQAALLARAGVGRLVLVDPDVPETSNLPRQLLYDEEDVAAARPKVEAAARRLRAANSELRVDPRREALGPGNALSLLDGVDVVLDGTDRLETRFVLNDACISRGVPWVYGGVLGTVGMALPVRPGGPCLRCLFPEPPPPGQPGPEELGVLNTLPALVAAYQVTLALRFLVGDPPPPRLLVVDPWHGRFQLLEQPRQPRCPCCVQRDFRFLRASGGDP